jgi:hypothetical protein
MVVGRCLGGVYHADVFTQVDGYCCRPHMPRMELRAHLDSPSMEVMMAYMNRYGLRPCQFRWVSVS